MKVGPTSKWELYDVARDPGETTDLSAERPDVVRVLVADAARWSEGHVESLWFHNRKSARDWEETDMPNYDRTFSTGLPK
ncbi:hypothetical protein [Alienimonas sp. DA493]|uniref:hypothetical protein n=1 Tax=Alienimonas sp. DA493 TaxID=3373605 RepID=UPI0037541F8B